MQNIIQVSFLRLYTPPLLRIIFLHLLRDCIYTPKVSVPTVVCTQGAAECGGNQCIAAIPPMSKLLTQILPYLVFKYKLHQKH